MKLLIIYSLKDEAKEGDYGQLKHLLGVDAVLQVKAENVLEDFQYPLFEIVEG